MTISKALNISLTGLNANQAALNVVSHNIANMNTEGYVKQRVNFAEVRTPTNDSSVSGQIASLSGVKVSGITTASTDYMNNYYRTQNSIYEGLLADADTASQLADLMDELSGTGLGDSLSDFFSAANSLNQNPTDYSLRINYAEKAKNVATKFNTMYTNLNNLQTSKIGNGTQSSADESEAGMYVSQLNSYLSQLVNVNKQITSNQDDASLKTQRDQLLSQISSLANVTTTINSTGTASVQLGNSELVKNNELQGTLEFNADGTVLFANNNGNVNDITSEITGGSLGGTLNGVSSISNAMESINKLAAAFAETMNSIQTYSDGDISAASYDRINDVLVVSTTDLFTSKDGGDITASNITINTDIYNNPDLIAAARVNTSEDNWNLSVGNGDNALELYNAQNLRLDSLGGLTMSDYMTALATKTALDATSKSNDADVQGAIVDGISNQILSETGVNLDEELTNMIMYQQAYSASARVFSACVEVFDTLVSLGQ